MEQPVLSRFSATHPTLSAVPGAKLMTVINLPRLLSSSQDPVHGHAASEPRHPRPWDDGTALQRVAAPTRVCAFPGPDTSPASHIDGLCTNLPLFLLG